MGFSLSRALAGAVVGATTAAGKMFDEGFAEDAKNRAREADLEKAKEVARFTDELTSAREERVNEMKLKTLARERAENKLIIGEQRSIMKEKNIDPGSAEGQSMIGTAFADAGRADQANIFYDNAQKFQLLKNQKEIHELEIKGRTDLARLARDTALANREDTKDAAAWLKAGELGKDIMHPVTNENGVTKMERFENGSAYSRKIFDAATASGKSRQEALQITSEFVGGANERIQAKKKEKPALSTSDIASSWMEATGKKYELKGFTAAPPLPDKLAPPDAAATAKKDKYIPPAVSLNASDREPTEKDIEYGSRFGPFGGLVKWGEQTNIDEEARRLAYIKQATQ